MSETTYKLTCTVADAEGTTTSFTLERNVPKFTFVDYEKWIDACAAGSDEVISVKAYIIGAIGKESSSSFGSLYLQDAQGRGYYAYAPALDSSIKTRDALNAAYPVGTEVIVSGTATNYSGQHEFYKGCSVTATGNTAEVLGIELPYTNATEAFATAESAKDAEKLDVYQNARVTLENCKLNSVSGDYYYFTVGDGTAKYNIYKTNYFLEDALLEEALAKFTAGYTATITGVVSCYSSSYQIYPDSVDTITITSSEMSAEDQANVVFDSLTIKENTKEDVDLPVEEGLTWSIKEETPAAKVENGKLVITRQSEDVVVTLVASYTVGTETFTREYQVTVVKGASSEPVVVTELQTGVPYKFGCEQENLSQTLFLTGNMSGYYLESTAELASSVDFYLEEVEGGYQVYTTIDGAKKYLEAYANGTYINVRYADEATVVWTYNSEYNTLTTPINDLDYYLGTYNTFNTFSASKLSYAATSFVGHFYQVPAAEPTVVETFEPNVGYLFGCEQENLSQTLFLSGNMSGYYLETTTEAASAAVFYVETVADGYQIYTTIEGAKKYLEAYANGTYINVRYADEATVVWTYNSEYNTFTTPINDLDYYLGTYNTFNTFSASKLSYAATSFVGHLYTKPNGTTVAPETPTDPETPEVEPETPEVDPVVVEGNVVTFSELGFENDTEVNVFQLGDALLTFDVNTGSTTPKYYDKGTAVRLYSQNTLTISSEKTIVSIKFVFAEGNEPTEENTVFNVGTYDYETFVLTVEGGTNEVILTRNSTSGHYRIISIEVVYQG